MNAMESILMSPMAKAHPKAKPLAMALVEAAARQGASAEEQTHLETVLEQLRQMTQTDWSLRD